MKVPAFIIVFAIFCTGLWLMGHAFEIETFQLETFLGGILVVSLAIAVPAHIMGRAE